MDGCTSLVVQRQSQYCLGKIRIFNRYLSRALSLSLFLCLICLWPLVCLASSIISFKVHSDGCEKLKLEECWMLFFPVYKLFFLLSLEKKYNFCLLFIGRYNTQELLNFLASHLYARSRVNSIGNLWTKKNGKVWNSCHVTLAEERERETTVAMAWPV